MNTCLIIFVAGSFSGKSLIASHIANKYQFSGVLSTDMVRNFYRVFTRDEQIFSTSTYKMSVIDLDKQKELVSKMVLEIIHIYQKRGEKMIVEGMHFSESFLSQVAQKGCLVIGLDNKIIMDEKIQYKKETTRSNVSTKTEKEKKRILEIHNELIDSCKRNSFNIVEFTDIEDAKKQCEQLVEIYLHSKSYRKMKKSLFKEAEVQKAYQFQLKNSDWTFYSEREFVEYILSQRFNYLVLLYSLFITAFAMIRGENNKIIVLSLGFLIVSMMGITIYRVYVKLMLNLEILDKLGDMHTFHFIRVKANQKKWYALFKVNPIIGKWLPLFFSVSLLVALLLIIFDLYHFEV